MATDLQPWIGVNLDGTLAEHYWPEKGAYEPTRIGNAIQSMVTRIKTWLPEDKDVRIYTARFEGGIIALKMGDPLGFEHRDTDRIIAAIEAWCVTNLGVALPVTCTKDYGMKELWDDRAIRVIQNTGEPCCDNNLRSNEPLYRKTICNKCSGGKNFDPLRCTVCQGHRYVYSPVNTIQMKSLSLKERINESPEVYDHVTQDAFTADWYQHADYEHNINQPAPLTSQQ
jgi:hypothetical protein